LGAQGCATTLAPPSDSRQAIPLSHSKGCYAHTAYCCVAAHAPFRAGSHRHERVPASGGRGAGYRPTHRCRGLARLHPGSRGAQIVTFKSPARGASRLCLPLAFALALWPTPRRSFGRACSGCRAIGQYKRTNSNALSCPCALCLRLGRVVGAQEGGKQTMPGPGNPTAMPGRRPVQPSMHTWRLGYRSIACAGALADPEAGLWPRLQQKPRAGCP